MTERCKICNNTGNVLVSDGKRKAGEVCDCRMREVWERYLGDLIRDVSYISPFAVKLIDSIIESYKYAEDIFKKEIKKHIYMFDMPLDKSQEKDMRFKNIYKSMFLLYLVKTKEFLSYKHYDLQRFIDMYWGVEVAGGKGELEQNFYDFKEETFILECTTIIPNKFAFDTIRHFLEFYKDRNIIIYASTRYKEGLSVRTKNQTTGQYSDQILDRSLKDILETEYKDSFVDIRKFINNNPFRIR